MTYLAVATRPCLAAYCGWWSRARLPSNHCFKLGSPCSITTRVEAASSHIPTKHTSEGCWPAWKKARCSVFFLSLHLDGNVQIFQHVLPKVLILHPRNHLIKLVLITSITYFPAFTCVLQGIGPPWLDTVARTTEPNLPWPSTSPLAWECSLIYLKTIEDFAGYEGIVPQQNSLVSAKLFLLTIPSILLLSSWLHLYRILNGSHKF